MPMPFATALLAAAGLLAAAVPGSAAGADLLTAARWTHRLLVVSAAHPGDPLLARQRAAFAAMRAGATERDLVLVEAVGHDAAAEDMRARLGLDPARFQAVLVGKDGGVKLRADGVLGSDALFALIDAMPMRQEEMRR